MSDDFIRRTDVIDCDLDNLDPNPLLRDVAQDLYSTDPPQETCGMQVMQTMGLRPGNMS